MDRPSRAPKRPKDFMDSEKLINEVRKYPALWDINCTDYRNRELKRSQWNKVAAAFVIYDRDATHDRNAFGFSHESILTVYFIFS